MRKNEMINNINLEKKYQETLMRSLKIIPEITECEYIYIDDFSNCNIKNSLLKNKIIITQDKYNNFLMFEINDIQEDGKIKNLTKLNSKLIVDMMILNNNETQENINNFIDQDTIITKNLGNNVIYMEDHRNDVYILITKYEKIVIKGRGIKTRILYHETMNT